VATEETRRADDPTIGAHAGRRIDRAPVGVTDHPNDGSPVEHAGLTPLERRLLGDLFAIVEEHAGDAAVQIDRARVEEAFIFACEHHADQLRKSGEDFIVHPVGVAKICAGMRLDTETLVAALLHDTVEDTSASLEEVNEKFGEEVANLVDGVTKLTGITFQSRDEQQAENYRKMMVAMATDIRVILIKLADRLHNISRASSRRSASTRRSQGARSTSTRSTRR
jgi:guanosine-3',5'-bis(diphosphate) 3'-pyrophosphohydrolase